MNLSLIDVAGVQIPHIQGLAPGMCLQPFSPTAFTQSLTVGTAGQPTYLIPKTLIQQQIAASAGNQPARVFTIKPASISPSGTDIDRHAHVAL